MRTPPLLIGTVLLLWGVQTGWGYAAVVMALLFEGARLVKSKWDIGQATFGRIADSCLVLLAVGFVYYLFTESEFIVLRVTGILPAAFFPLAVALEYSTAGTIEVGTLFLQFRKKLKGAAGDLARTKTKMSLHLSYPYFVCCMLGAAAHYYIRKDKYYVLVFLFFGWALWKLRSKRYSPVTWVILLLFVGMAGFTLYVGMARINRQITMALDFTPRPPGGDERATAIGKKGKLEESNQIMFRFAFDGEGDVQQEYADLDNSPLLLREKVLNIYGAPIWYASDKAFRPVKQGRRPGEWMLYPHKEYKKSIIVSSYLTQGKGVLQLPGGTGFLENLPVSGVKKNAFGSVKVAGGPGVMDYRVSYEPRYDFDAPPVLFDLHIPTAEKKVLEELAARLNLPPAPLPVKGKEARPSGRVQKNAGAGLQLRQFRTDAEAEEIVTIVEDFFRENFKYSLINAGKGHSKTALENFLLVSRSGHCEYFATATVLLLRACGLPARYVTGYSAQEYSPLEEKIVVRAKHAHAWTQVYLKGKWQTLDTTPESHHDGDDGFSIFKWGSDWIAFIKFKLLQWRWKIFGNLPLLYLFLPMIPFFFFLLRRAFRKKKKKSTGRVQKKTTAPPLPIKRTNSEFHLMEQKMKALGLERSHGETRYRWLQRLEEQLSSRVKAQTSSSIIQLHYRDRFSAQSLTALQKDLLKKQIKVFMDGIDEREGIDEHRDIEESEA